MRKPRVPSWITTELIFAAIIVLSMIGVFVTSAVEGWL